MEISYNWVMVFSATVNNISVISWRSVLLVEENRSTQKKPLTCHQSLSHNAVSSTPCLCGIRTRNFCGNRHRLHKVVINPTTIRSRQPSMRSHKLNMVHQTQMLLNHVLPQGQLCCCPCRRGS